MGIFDFLLKRDNVETICFDALQDHWELYGKVEAEDFFRAIPIIIPKDAMLYCIGGIYQNKKSRELMDSIASYPPPEIERKSFWFKQRKCCVPVTPENMELLATATAEFHTLEFEFVEHFFAYSGSEALLCWYDAFLEYPIYISSRTEEDKIKDFSKKLGLDFKFTRVN